ncbi:PASTA domain-containing protein [Clostridium sp. DL1XJH146]
MSEKSFLDTLSQDTKPESFGEEKFEYVKDNKLRNRLILIGCSVAIVVSAYFGISYFTNRIEVPELVGMNINDAYTWASNNDVTLAIDDVYNFDVDKNVVISQGVAQEEVIKKNSTLAVEVSLGADPEELIVFPDIEAMTYTEIESWIDDNKLTGITITTEYSDIVVEDAVISYEFVDGSEDEFERKNRVNVVVSDGIEELSETVTVPDFSTYKQAEIVTWGSENGIAVEFEEVFDEYVQAGSVASQSFATDDEMYRDETLLVQISKGEAVYVPNITAMTKTEAEAWAKENGITLNTKEIYTNSYSDGDIYSQSISSGTSLENGDSITVNVSLGKVEVASFEGKSKLDVMKWVQEVNENGANISVSYSEGYGTAGSVDKIIGQSIKNDMVNTGKAISFTVSKGMKLVIPDFTGMTEEQVENQAKDTGIDCLFDYAYSEPSDPDNLESAPLVEKGYVISQSIAANTVTTDAENITVVISLGVTD